MLWRPERYQREHSMQGAVVCPYLARSLRQMWETAVSPHSAAVEMTNSGALPMRSGATSSLVHSPGSTAFKVKPVSSALDFSENAVALRFHS